MLSRNMTPGTVSYCVRISACEKGKLMRRAFDAYADMLCQAMKPNMQAMKPNMLSYSVLSVPAGRVWKCVGHST